MENNSYSVLDQLDYLEFRQNLLILKEPCHKAIVFFDLDIGIYLEMKEKSKEFCEKISNGQNLNLLDYEKLLISIWPTIRNYPSAYSIIAKSLLDKKSFDIITNN